MNDKQLLMVILAVTLIVVMCCCMLLLCLASAVGLGAWGIQSMSTNNDLDLPYGGEATETPLVVRPTKTSTPSTAGEWQEGEEPGGPGTPEPPGSDTLKTLQQAIVPTADLRDLAGRLEGKEDIPVTLDPPPPTPQKGEQKSFWVTNVDEDENFQIKAILRFVGNNSYFWVDEEVKFNNKDLQRLAKTFDEEIYDTNREFFGTEYKPGIDGDPKIYVLLARGLGSTIAGYFPSADSFSSQAHEYSNEREMILLNADGVDMRDEFTYGVLAHEFQHMIHWYHDRNEETWLNEGFSELASFLNGYGTGGFDYAFVNYPDMQLTYWPGGDTDTTPHYGAAFLFTNYFLGRFGEDATQTLVGSKANGMVSVDGALQEIGAKSPVSGEPLTANELFLDWTIANYLNDEDVADGRFAYKEYPDAPRTSDSEVISECPTEMLTRDVHQYGADYIKVTCPGEHTLFFEGSTQVKILPTDAHSGMYAFWSNRGDDSNMTLTHTFDLQDVDESVSMTYWTWYDLEENYDYLYVLASIDGEKWDILKTPSGTDYDPSGNSYGWGYNNVSGSGPEWIEETVDLSDYAGKKIDIRFEYVTDAAVNGEGFFLDDVEIPAIGYRSDFEKGDDGWEAQGFVRVENLLPQTFRLALISEGQRTEVDYVPLSGDNSAEISLKIGDDVDNAVLVVTGTTRFTNQTAAYRLQVVDRGD